MKLMAGDESQGIKQTGTGQTPEEWLVGSGQKNKRDSLEPWKMAGQYTGNKVLPLQTE